MIQYDELKDFAMPELVKIKTRMIANNDYESLYMMKSALYYSNIDIAIPERTFYSDRHNVHTIARATEEAALEIIKAYPAEYRRPHELRACCVHFFDMIENGGAFNSFDPKQLFASVYECVRVNKHHDLMNRLKEEMLDANNGVCLTGCVARLVNVLRGYELNFDVNIDEYEYERCKVFHLLSLELTDSENIADDVEKVVNSGIVEINKEYGTRILEAYTGDMWITTPCGKYAVEMNQTV